MQDEGYASRGFRGSRRQRENEVSSNICSWYNSVRSPEPKKKDQPRSNMYRASNDDIRAFRALRGR